MAHPIIYDKNETNFFHLGLGVLSDTIECIVVEELNGIFEMKLRYPITGVNFDALQVDNIIKVDTGHRVESTEQRFRIKRIVKNNQGTVDVYAQHVSYLAQGMGMQPVISLSGSGMTALSGWNQQIIGDTPFTTFSNITTNNSTSLTIQNVDNARRVLGGVEGSILDTWGGEYLFNNYHISLLNQRGSSANTIIAYGRNLTDLEQEENISNTFTSVYPFAIYRDEGSDEERIVTIPGFIIDSEHVNNFPQRRVRKIDFSREFEQAEVPTSERLRQLAEQFIVANGVGIPKVSLRISFVDLTKTLNYDGPGRMEQLNLADSVAIYFEKLGIQTRAKIVRVEWDVLLEQYRTLEIGEMRASLSDRLNGIQGSIDRQQNEIDSANNAIVNAQGNTVFFGPDEPTPNRIGDLWYQQDGELIILWMWNGYAWEFIMSTADFDLEVAELVGRIQAAEEAATQAVQNANAAFENAQTARNEAQEAFDRAGDALNQAGNAVITAGNVESNLTVFAGRIDGEMLALGARVTSAEGVGTDALILAQGLQFNVFDDPNGLSTQLTQLAGQWNVFAQNDFAGIRASILADAQGIIDLRVSYNDVINAINISTEGIVINGNRIHITGDTFIDNAVIQAAHIGSINANTITTGTLNAANVNIINLNVNNLVGNMTQFTQSHWNTVTSAVQIDGDGLQLFQDGVRRANLRGDELVMFNPAGAQLARLGFTWNPAAPDNNGVSLIAEPNGRISLNARRHGAIGVNSFSRLRVFGESGNVHAWGDWTFFQDEDGNGNDITVNLNNTFRARWIGTTGFANNSRLQLVNQAAGGVAIRNEANNSGITINNNGTLQYTERGFHRNFPVIIRANFTINFPTANVTNSFNVNFPPGAFPGVPTISISVNSAVPQQVSVGVNSISATGCTVHMHRTTAVNTTFHLTAIWM